MIFWLTCLRSQDVQSLNPLPPCHIPLLLQESSDVKLALHLGDTISQGLCWVGPWSMPLLGHLFFSTQFCTPPPNSLKRMIFHLFFSRENTKSTKKLLHKTTGTNKMSQSLEKWITKEEVNNLIGYVGWRDSTGIQPLTLHEADTGSIHGSCIWSWYWHEWSLSTKPEPSLEHCHIWQKPAHSYRLST